MSIGEIDDAIVKIEYCINDYKDVEKKEKMFNWLFNINIARKYFEKSIINVSDCINELHKHIYEVEKSDRMDKNKEIKKYHILITKANLKKGTCYNHYMHNPDDARDVFEKIIK